MFGSSNPTRMIPWAHHFLSEVLRPGDLAVDLTAGNGHDTLFLFQSVGDSGKVLAFDIQQAALERTGERLHAAGAAVTLKTDRNTLPDSAPGVYLVRDCHSRLADYLHRPPRAIIANLGYLPGGDAALITKSDSTLGALGTALDFLAPGGRIAVVVYVGHPGGREEGAAVEVLFRGLPTGQWQVLKLEAANRQQAPFLLAAQKK
jgi:SAM-dependent methyltransferase